MQETLSALIPLLGLLVLPFAVWSSPRALRLRRSGVISGKSYATFQLAGFALGIGSLWMGYPWGSDWWILGVPFPAAGFQRMENGWADYIGPLTVIFVIMNFLFWYCLPTLLLCISQKLKRPAPGAAAGALRRD